MSDLRQFPRIHTQLKAILTNSSNTESTATINNISPGGVLLHGDLALKQHICELEERDPMYHSIEVFLKCRFPEEPQPFLSRCRLIYVRRLSQHEFDFGLRFV
ncbi:MAG TPA: PilZ domain-containing protein, partial [Motiliproteus sp.]